jgi:hypothetical protein
VLPSLLTTNGMLIALRYRCTMTCSWCNAIGHKEREKERERHTIDVVRGPRS